MHLLHTLVWNGKARRAGGGGSLTFPRIAPVEEAAWASPPRTIPHHDQGRSQHLWVQWRHRTGTRPVAPSALGLHPLAPGKFPVCGDCSSQRGCRILPPWAVDWEVAGLRDACLSRVSMVTPHWSTPPRDGPGFLRIKMRLTAILEQLQGWNRKRTWLPHSWFPLLRLTSVAPPEHAM